jgi:hypothetical protein
MFVSKETTGSVSSLLLDAPDSKQGTEEKRQWLVLELKTKVLFRTGLQD